MKFIQQAPELFIDISPVTDVKNLNNLNNFLQHEAVELSQIGDLTSDRYSRIAAQLKRQGTPIPTNDIWIAAQTMEHGVELVTSDQHFEKIGGLVCTIFPS